MHSSARRYLFWGCELEDKILIVTSRTTFSVEGFRVKESKGIVRGIIVRSPSIGQGSLGGLKSVIVSKIGAQTQRCEQARWPAYDLRIQQQAEGVEADRIIGLAYDVAKVLANSNEILCYGTAVAPERM